MTPVSLANILGAAKVFIYGGISFVYVTKSKDPRINPWGISSLLSHNLRKKFEHT
jgi:hypothetical protein